MKLYNVTNPISGSGISAGEIVLNVGETKEFPLQDAKWLIKTYSFLSLNDLDRPDFFNNEYYTFEEKEFINPSEKIIMENETQNEVEELETPVTEIPVTEAPVTEAPVSETPVTEAPVTEAPVSETPVADEVPGEETSLN